MYVKALHKHLTYNNIFTTANAAFAVFADLVLAINKLDGTITQGMLLAENRCRKKPRPAWSAALTAASRTVKFWKRAISGVAIHANMQPILLQIGAFLRWD